jgi:small subunit ribosomal protein S8
MVLNDPISDMLTRIRNAGMAHHAEVSMPTSKMKVAIANVLEQEGYVTSSKVEQGDGPQGTLHLTLKFHNRKPVIAGLERVSKPSCRIYAGAGDIPRVMGGLGILILSTPDGVITGKEARSRNVGGEILCKIW